MLRMLDASNNNETCEKLPTMVSKQTDAVEGKMLLAAVSAVRRMRWVILRPVA